MTFGEKLLNLRKQANLTQNDLADKLNISRQAITKWERGVGLPDIDNIKKISSLFNISIDNLLDYKIENINISINNEENINHEKLSLKNVDEFILNRYNKAQAIYKLTASPKLNFWKSIFYTLFDIDIALLTHDLIQNGLTFTYLIEEDGTELLVIVNKTSLLEKKLTTKFENKLTLDGYTYSKYKNCKIK